MKGFHVLLNYSYTNVKKTVYLKNIWMRHSSRAGCEAGIKEFLKGRGGGAQRRGNCFKRVDLREWFMVFNR